MLLERSGPGGEDSDDDVDDDDDDDEMIIMESMGVMCVRCALESSSSRVLSSGETGRKCASWLGTLSFLCLSAQSGQNKTTAIIANN